MWKSGLARTWDWILSRRLVGEDRYHLFYSEFVAKGKPEKRYVEYKDKNITHSSDRMPIEWWSWLHNRRDSIPTLEELEFSELKKEHLAEKVAILEAEDEKQRLRQFSGTKPLRTNAEEEARARRRKNVMLELARPPQSAADAPLSVSKAVKPVGFHDDRNTRNEGQESTVGYRIML